MASPAMPLTASIKLKIQYRRKERGGCGFSKEVTHRYAAGISSIARVLRGCKPYLSAMLIYPRTATTGTMKVRSIVWLLASEMLTTTL